MNILAMETSCDETAVAIVANGRLILSNAIASQWEVHRKYGGVVPELAARSQVTAIVPMLNTALAEADIDQAAIDVIAVANGPGLAGSLLVGVNVAKSIAYGLNRPLVAVNHLEAHIYANWLTEVGDEATTPPRFPALCLLASGGHTELILMYGHGQYEHLGQTLDDAAGEAFDKAARSLGVGMPGGPAIQALANQGVIGDLTLPRSWLGESYDFSFSGLKTALLRQVEPFRLTDELELKQNGLPFKEHRLPRYRDDLPVANLAAEFQEAVVDVLVSKTVRAARQYAVRTVMLAGGVAANQRLRERIGREVEQLSGSVETRIPAVGFCTDNAAMVASAAYFAIGRGVQVGWNLDVEPRLRLVDVGT